jgi:hypothetical protein
MMGGVCFPVGHPRNAGVLSALSALLSFPADARAKHHISPGAFGFLFLPEAVMIRVAASHHIAFISPPDHVWLWCTSASQAGMS